MEPIVASLWSSFGRVPPVAIPAMLDCLLASTAASPSTLTFQLLNEYPKLSKRITHKSEIRDSELHNSVAAYVAALCHLVKKSGPHNMRIVVWTMWIPLMKLVYPFDRELFNEVASLFLNVVAETNNWEVLEATVVPMLLRSIGLSMGMVKNEQFAIYKWSASKDNEVIPIPLEDFHDKSIKKYSLEEFLVGNSYDLSLSISCNILILTLEAALRNKYERVASESTLANASRAKSFVGNVIWDLSSFTLQMLLETLEHRSIAIRFLLPFIFKAFARAYTFRVAVPGMSHTITRNDFFRKIWKCCKLLFSMGSLERRDGYDILSLYLSLPSLSSELEDVNVDERETFDLRADQEFWDELKRGLLDKESLLRKQSLHILKTTLNLNKERKCYSDILEETSDERGSNSHTMTKKGRWADQEAQSLGVGRLCNHNELSPTGWYRWEAFVFLYEMLEEYGTHLVEAAWNHQIMLLLRSSFPSENSIGSIDEQELYYNRMATAEQIFEWLTILWERGFCHDNPQVRCLIMQSFLSIKWENYECCAKVVQKDFILGPLMQGLNDPAHHREFGIKEIYSSRTIQAAARFLCSYASYMEGRQHILFLVDLSSVSKTHSFGRAGLMCLVECIASAACSVAKHNDCDIEHFTNATTDQITVKTAPNSCQIDKANLLDVFRFILDCSKQHFNPKYRYQVCEKVLAAAAAVMTGNDVPLESLLHFISSLPREYTDYGGSLRCVVQKWLRGPDLQLLKAIDRLPMKFLNLENQLDTQFMYDDEELEAWGPEAKRWARVLFLVVQDMEHFDPILKFIQDHGGDICNMKNHPELVEVKFLILVYNMVDELQIIQERKATYRVTRGVDGDLDTPRTIDNLSCMGESIIFDKFTVVLLSFLDQLISFTKSSCSVFWSDVVTDTMILPDSIRGKLGGPSQRRLSTSLCTSVLEAITSVKTLSSVLRWCAQFNMHGLINSAQSFLWNFCWKAITTSAPKSEVEAEIRIASYEACGHALVDLVSIFSPLALDLVTDNDNSVPLQRDDKALLDVFVSTFIHNINSIIDGGNLTRSRRAILMNCKWSCLESLLSLPNHAINNGVHLKACTFFFSEKIIPHIFDDLVESLENAGEASVLPLLRSVRLTMELFDSRKSEPSISCCDGITVEMMWLLVNSSWILHISCNKRRVAPIASLLSSVLHHSVFGDHCMHESDNGPGPLKWFVEKILEEGTKSPRTIRLASLHLCGLWLAYPDILQYYIKELKLLTFYGSVAFDEDFEAELTGNYEARAEVSVLSRSLEPELTDVFINTELYARVSVAVLFSKLADMAYLYKSTSRSEDIPAVIASGKLFLLELLNSVVNDKDLSKELYKKYSAIHRRKVRAWQMICAVSRFVELDIVEQVTSSLHISIYRNNLPSVRQYLETFAIYIYLKFPLLVGQELVYKLRNYDLRPQALSLYVFIAANVILHAKRETQVGHLNELLPPIVPLLTSHHHTLRGFTQILVYHVLEKLLPESNHNTSGCMSLEERCFVDLREYLAHNSDCARLRASMINYLDSFDPLKSVSPVGIFTNRVEEQEFECVGTTLMDRVIDFLNDARENLRSSMSKDAAAIKKESIHVEEGSKCDERSNGGQSAIQKELLYDFQRKISFSKNEQQGTVPTASLNQKTSQESLMQMESEDQLIDQLLHSRGVIIEKLKSSRQQIVIVASLIDRIPNLAGLARTCEVFRAAGLAIANKNILNDKQFKLISVTADKWVPVLEVTVESMKIFLEKKKQEGYAVLGLEQTANSIPLDQYNFPTKTVLVLGREKEGIPVEIIHMLDACIEIPQLGVVRSLNVHVNDKDLSKELYKKYSAIHRRKVRAWQMICAVSRFVELDIVEQVTSSLHISIYRNNLPSVRQYLETFAIYIYLKFPLLVGQELVYKLRNYDLRPQALSLYVFIAANVILHAKRETQVGHLNELLPPIVPLLTSHHHTLRGFTQILVYHVLEKLLPESNHNTSGCMSLEERCFVDLREYLAHNSDCARLRASMINYLDSFDPLKSVSPVGIFTNRVEEQEFECVGTTLMDRVIDFLNDARENLRSSMSKDAAAIKKESIHVEEGSKCDERSNGGQSAIQKELLYDFQRKISFSKNEQQGTVPTASLNQKTSQESLMQMESEDQLIDQLLHSRGVIIEKLKSSRQQIVIVASLIDRIPNLAGLARTCEVFRAAGLAIANKNILNDKQFKLISVTADKWVPVLEVTVESMKIFLEKKKQEGYAVLGLEQTANSIPLDQYNFPTKTVLVLGREKEGIPVEIIHMLDACIEIPQLGVVRSLNVHVSGAIALWEYTRQQRLHAQMSPNTRH